MFNPTPSAKPRGGFLVPTPALDGFLVLHRVGCFPGAMPILAHTSWRLIARSDMVDSCHGIDLETYAAFGAALPADWNRWDDRWDE